MIGPLVKNMSIKFFNTGRNYVFTYNCYTKPGNQLIYSVIYFGVNMIRSACKNKNFLPLFFRLGNNFISLVNYFFSVFALFFICFLRSSPYFIKRKTRKMLRQLFISFLRKIKLSLFPTILTSLMFIIQYCGENVNTF